MKHFLFILITIVTSVGHAQQTEVVDFKKIDASITFEPDTKKVIGDLYVEFHVIKASDSLYLDAIGMEITKISSKGVQVGSTRDKIWIHGNFETGKTYQTSFSYIAYPRQTLYFTGDQIWTQGQGKYTSHWLPSIDDMNDKIEFDLQIIANPQVTVIANGALKEVNSIDTDSRAWRFDMVQPMSSYLVAVAIGDFRKKEINSHSGIPIELYFKPEDSLKVEPTYRHTREIFDFLEAEIGIPYPWQNYKQIPVRDFLYAGMENTTATIFSEAFVVDSIGFNDRNYINVNAHELAHHWFGNLVTESSGDHHWLQEGFATYYAHLVEKELFGSDYYYWQLYQTAEQLRELSEAGKGESLLNPKASSLTFYEKGAWALHVLRELIGDEAFKTAIANYLSNNKFGNVTTADFLREVRAVSTVDIDHWEEDWLKQTAFNSTQVFNSLSRSEFMNRYFQISSLRATPVMQKIGELRDAILGGNDFIGQEAVYQLSGEDRFVTHALYEHALDSDNLYIRQAVAVSMDGVSERLKPKFEKLLQDSSYVTIEAALYNLWSSFPEDRTRYLEITRSVEGFQDKNVRQLWLALAVITEGYRTDEKTSFVNELRGYTSNTYSFEVRQLAFRYVNDLRLFNDEVLDNLIDASVHHNWRFRNASRTLFSEIIKNPGTGDEILKRLDTYSEKEQQFLQTQLKA
ncbi:aminopeptidase [Pukyongia salina]|uniref:Aminopeptidase N n=2 Tax=Pukyongia salina TaxID=2094025 RepID=A0A2S0HY70_9FLAO|nr:aminopeptidase [Pukyongia salina]